MRRHFLESLEREIDYDREYRKLEEMVVNEFIYYGSYGRESINMWIERNFRNWKKRNNFTSFAELRQHNGFPVEEKSTFSWRINTNRVGIDEYFLYGEMILNITTDLVRFAYPSIAQGMDYVIETLKSNVEQAGFEAKRIKNSWIIVEKNIVALEVADKVSELSDVVIEYNHHLLKGNMERKQQILKKIADSIEPKRKILNNLDKKMTSDFFFLVNKMNIRHNNCDLSDSSHYCKAFDQLTPSEKEAWYDTIYEQGLALFVLLEQQERNRKIEAFKSTL